MLNELISIIVTCYNRETSILNCLDSIQKQTYTNFECIIINDGSTDNSLNLIKNFTKTDNRFKLINSNHVGFPLAKNIGLDNAIGNYIIFLDSDDTAYPYWLEFLYLACKLNNAPISTCYYDRFTSSKQKEPNRIKLLTNGLPLAEYSYLKMLLLYHNSCSSYMWNKLIKKELYKEIRHTDQLALSDVSVMYKIFAKADKIIQVKLPLIHYYVHENSMSAKTKQLGLDYWTFRLKVLAERNNFIFKNYPQARFIVKQCTILEIDNAKKELTKEDFNKLDLTEFTEILKDNTLPIVL